MRVLDLGCGKGLTPQKLSFPAAGQIIGLDISYVALSEAHRNFPHRVFVCSEGERLPFPASTFDCVISNLAIPYMDIARTLAEVYRVLLPGGMLLASLHPLSFTLGELRDTLPKPKLALRRVWVLANGILFHAAGRSFGESFQTERGVRIALQRANFGGVSFRHDSKRWFVEAAPLKLASALGGDANFAA
jgi:SAM-dependent methyltransferase